MVSTKKTTLVALLLGICTFKSDAASLSTSQKIGIGVAAAAVVGFALWAMNRETAADIPVYLAKVENDLIKVEAHSYIRAWLNGPDWQAWMYNQAASQKNAAGIGAILHELKELKELLYLSLLDRAYKLAVNNNTSIDRCTQYKMRAERLRASVDEMIRMVEPLYKQRREAEDLEAEYEDYRKNIQSIATNDLVLDLRGIKNRALSTFPTSNWPYADAVCRLDGYKNRLNSLLRGIGAAKYHPQQRILISQATELRDGILWAISELQSSPEYAQQLRLKRTSDEQNAERIRLENQRRQMEEDLRRRNEELRRAQERQQRELDELNRRERDRQEREQRERRQQQAQQNQQRPEREVAGPEFEIA